MCAVLKGHTDPISSVDFSPDGRFLVSASWDFTIRLWRTRDGSSRELSDVASMANSVVFSPLGRYIFSGDNHGFLRSCDTRTDKLVAKWKGHAGIIWCVSFSKDGKGLVSGGKDMLLKYWDVSSDAHHLRFGSSVVNTSNAEERKEIMRFEGHTVRSPPYSLLHTRLFNHRRLPLVRSSTHLMVDGFFPQVEVTAAQSSGMQRQLRGSVF